MVTALLAVLLGLTLLVWSADQFITGAIDIARRLGMSPMLIGLTLVAFGTSTPEVLVSVTAAITDAGDIAVGNAIGSNIANLGLVLGTTALLAPVALARPTRRIELPLLAVVTIGSWLLFRDDHLDAMDGLAMLAILGVTFTLLVRFGQAANLFAEEIPEPHHNRSSAFLALQLTAGLLLLLASSRLLVWGAVELALALGVSELVIGLTMVAVGTSLPELATSIASALKGRHDMVLGNLIGSNLFNLLLVLAVPALITGIPLNEEAITRDYGAMVATTLLLSALAIIHHRQGRLNRVGGGILLAFYIGYIALLVTGDAPVPAATLSAL
ncbi:calcium/sodium antiporter [Halomonadaceae bacterium KBTZ08]